MNKTTHSDRSRFPTDTLWFGVALLIIGLPTLVSAQKVAGNEVTLASAQKIAGNEATLVSAQKIAGNEAQNKKLIRQVFEQWASGNGNLFALLTDDVQWTIAGSSPVSKTYTSKQQLINETVTPLTSRLATPIVPKIRGVYADGDVVVALWDGTATAKDGQPYRNTYCWIMTLKNGRITHVVAFLDLIKYTNVLNGISDGN